MFERLEPFLATWEREAAMTQRVLDAFTDEALGQSVAPGHRDARRIAWHLVQTLPEMMGRTGLEVEGPGVEALPPLRSGAIADAYRQSASSLAERMRETWSDDTLAESDDMYGERWTRGRTLGALLLHQAHHRGQLTVLLRQAGLPVPGTHGPSLEEWGRWGVEPPAI